MVRTLSHYRVEEEIGGGHVPNDFRAFVREALDWFDKYLGPVK